METVTRKLPIGIQDFETIITEGYTYIDKTRYLVDLIDRGRVYFYARPRRFGKSLTTTSLKALFEGKKELFKGLYAEEFLNRPSFRPSPVIRLDMSLITTDKGVDIIEKSILQQIKILAGNFGVEIVDDISSEMAFQSLIINVCKKYGEKTVILIDEYDKPYSDFYLDPAMAEKVRNICRNFYIQVKANEEYIRFVFLTGISKFTKLGVFSTLNNLMDISMDKAYGEMCGLTEQEILLNFPRQIEQVAEYYDFTVEKIIEQMRYYYNGFCFDGVHKMYNPFSALNFLRLKEFDNYWMSSGGQKAVSDYLKNHKLTVEQFRNVQVSRDFVMNPGDVDNTNAEGFFYQTGYLTLRDGIYNDYTLDYPNKEVLDTMSAMLSSTILQNEGETFFDFKNSLFRAIANKNSDDFVKVLNRFLAGIPYDDFAKSASYRISEEETYNKIPAHEWLYRSSLLAFFRGAGIMAFGEMHTNKGRSDIVLTNRGSTFVLEIKVAYTVEEAPAKLAEAKRQILSHDYAMPYPDAINLALIIDDTQRQITVNEEVIR
jgi:hypothetical protein